MLRLGLKLFADNTHLAAEARQLLDEGAFSYIELYVPPGTYEDSIATWRQCGGPYVIHAPHWGHGVNLADASLCESNRTLLRDAQRFADALAADYIIVHGGNGGTASEAGRQIQGLGDSRIALENVPRQGTKGEECAVYSPGQIQDFLATEIISSFVLDIGHAIYTANDLGIDAIRYLEAFSALKPACFHLSDGDSRGTADVHLNVGDGDFHFCSLFSCIPEGALVTLETPRQRQDTLEEARSDAMKIIELEQGYFKKSACKS